MKVSGLNDQSISALFHWWFSSIRNRNLNLPIQKKIENSKKGLWLRNLEWVDWQLKCVLFYLYGYAISWGDGIWSETCDIQQSWNYHSSKKNLWYHLSRLSGCWWCYLSIATGPGRQAFTGTDHQTTKNHPYGIKWNIPKFRRCILVNLYSWQPESTLVDHICSFSMQLERCCHHAAYC